MSYRPETESWVNHLATVIEPNLKSTQALGILDLCTGTGNIALLLYQRLTSKMTQLKILGVDEKYEGKAIANTNLNYNIRERGLNKDARLNVRFARADIFKPVNHPDINQTRWDILVANPPYISPKDFDRKTARSVRNWEPRSALVPASPSSTPPSSTSPPSISQPSASTDPESSSPPSSSPSSASTAEEDGDLFYPRLTEIAEELGSNLVVFEVGDMNQAKRVAKMIKARHQGTKWKGCEIWRDFPAQGTVQQKPLGKSNVKIRGKGEGRTVLAWTVDGVSLVGKRLFKPGEKNYKARKYVTLRMREKEALKLREVRERPPKRSARGKWSEKEIRDESKQDSEEKFEEKVAEKSAGMTAE